MTYLTKRSRALHAERNLSPQSLIARLSDRSPEVRVDARSQLISIGPSAIPYLRALLSSGATHARWEAVKTLGEIHDPASIDALISALNDEERDIRWSAAECIIAFGADAFEPVLKALISNADFIGLRQSAAHILAGLRDEEEFAVVAPVFKALHGRADLFETPVAAYTALKALRENRATRFGRSSYRHNIARHL